jgi:hypothetical protein
MSGSRIPENARASLRDREVLAERIEREVERIREARPHLSSRLDRASALLVAQLSLPPQTRPVRVRIGTDGRRPRFLVRSLTSGGVVYCVIPGTFECSCPDVHRRGQGRGCKHSLAVYILLRAARTQRRGCSACERGWVFVGEEILDPESGELVGAINPVRCTRCGDGLSHELVQQWLEGQNWIFAKSRAANPHWYCLRRNAGDEATFEQVVEHLREYGSPYVWWGSTYLQYPAGRYAYWSMGASVENTELINRKSLEQVRIDELRNTGGGGVQWGWLHRNIGAEREELRRQEAGQEELGEG